MPWIRSLSLSAIFLAWLVALSACKEPYPHPRFRGAGATVPHRGGTLRYALSSDVRSLDPHVGFDEYSIACTHMIFDTLVDYAPGSTELVPSLAERWDVADQGRIYTFHLRHDVRFHNGRRLVADDVRKSFERMLDPARVPSPGTSFYQTIEGFGAFQSHRAPHVAGIIVLDPLTVQFRLTQADQTFLSALAMPFAAPIPVEIADAVGSTGFSQAPVGTGPFVLAHWEPATRITLRRFPHYWRPNRPYLDEVAIDISIAGHLQFMRFQHGDLDYVHSGSLSTSDYLWLLEHPAWRPYVSVGPEISTSGLAMNTELFPWNNVHVRRAVAFAIDRETIARARNYRIRPLGGLYPPGLPGYDPHLPNAQKYDLARARREMALAGYPGGIPGEYELWVGEGAGGAINGQFIQSDLRQIGINIRLRQVTFSVFLENTERRGAVGMSFAGWSQDFPDPADFVETLFHSNSIQPENSQNQSFYSNPRLDELLNRARAESDRERRLELYREAERIVVDDAPWAFLFYPLRTEAKQPYVRDYVPNPVFANDFRDAWLDLPLRRFTAGAHTPGSRDGLSALGAFVFPRRAR